MASERAQAAPVRALPQQAGVAYDRVPPHNLEAEVSVVGSMLLSKDAIAEVTEIVGPEDFYRGAHRTMFEAARELYDRGEPVDPVTLADELERRGTIDDVGGVAAIDQVVRRVPTAANALYYGRIVADHALRRRLIDAGTEITRHGYEPEQGVDEAVDAAERLIFNVAQRGRLGEFTPMKELLTASFDLIERLHENNTAITGLPTGFIDFDELTGGLQPSNLVILAARPGLGKCQSGSTPILDPLTGAVRRLDEVVRAARHGQRVRVASLGPDLRLHAAAASQVHDNGVQRVFRVRTRLGREVVATANHPLLTSDGWLPLALLRPGRRIATPRVLPYFGDQALADDEVALLGRLAGGRGVTAPPPRRTTTPPRLLQELTSCAAAALFVPQPIFTAPREQVALFLNRLFARDARVDVHGAHTHVRYASASETLLRQVQHLLLRFGVIAQLRRPRLTPRDGSGTALWELRISAAGSVRTFAEQIGIFGREQQLERALELLERIDDSRGRDLVPANHDRRVGIASPSRLSLAEAASPFQDAVLSHVATSDVYWDDIVGIEPAGEERVFDLSVPGDHNFVAADVIVHNSTLVTNIASHVAVEQRKPAVMFSLEMSQMELVQRVLASEARVDSGRLRTGRLQEQDWPRLSQAMGRLAEAPLFIDDTAGINMMEIRSKCRRLKQKHGLSLVIVDYLQLMQSHRRVENRVQEVAELSRGLKILAKELEIPVIALSQLNRKSEDRTDRRPQLADLRESGCLTADTRILRADTNAETTLGELVASGARDVPVWTVDEHRRLVRSTLTHAFPSGTKPTFRVTLNSGRAVTATANHPFITPDGWRPLAELGTGSRVGVPGRVGPPVTVTRWSPGRIVSLAHLIGRGRRVTPRAFRPCGAVGRGGFIPDAVHGLPDDALALFIRQLWAASGSVSRHGRTLDVSYRSASRHVVTGLQSLLLRFGVVSHVRRVHAAPRAAGYQLAVASAESQLRFLQRVGLDGRRDPQVPQLIELLAGVCDNSDIGTVPVAAGSADCRGALAPSPSQASVLGGPPPVDAATRDVVWDDVVSIHALGPQPVFDATVRGTHNFIANGIVLHNSIEQDADVVCFIYRDEVYHEDSDAKGEAELIVAKHRNGPLKTVRLSFIGHLSRFANMARGPIGGGGGPL